MQPQFRVVRATEKSRIEIQRVPSTAFGSYRNDKSHNPLKNFLPQEEVKALLLKGTLKEIVQPVRDMKVYIFKEMLFGLCKSEIVFTRMNPTVTLISTTANFRRFH